MILTKYWLRFWRNGPGLAWTPATAPKLFSERHGYRRTVTVGGWRFTWLRGGR